MSVSYNSSIVRNGLICYLDAANPASYTPGQNLLTYSEEFNNAAWGKGNCTITADAVVAPNGTTTAERLVEDATNGEHSLYYSQTITNVTQTFSVYAKAGERSLMALQFSNFVNAAAQVGFNLATGTVLFTGAGNADYSNISARIDSIGNGWFRCSLTATKGSVNTSNNPLIQAYNGSSSSFASNTSTGFYIWGAQLETNSSMGPYIQTVASNAPTRSTTWVNLMGNATYNATLTGAVYNSTSAAVPATMEFLGNSGSKAVMAGLDLRTTNHTIIVSSRYSGGSRGRVVGGNLNNYLLGHYSNSAGRYYPGNWVFQNGTWNDTRWWVHAGTGSTLTDYWQFFMNGEFMAGNTNGVSGPNGIVFGGDGVYGDWSTCQVGAFLAYDRILSANEIAQTTAAIRGRYGA